METSTINITTNELAVLQAVAQNEMN